MNFPEIPSGSHELVWSYPDAGTCGNPVDKLSIVVYRVAHVPTLVVGFDLNRYGWSIGENYFETPESENYTYRELRFIPYEEFQESEPDQDPDNSLNATTPKESDPQ